MMDIGKELQAAFDDGYAARDKEIVRCGECKHWDKWACDKDGGHECLYNGGVWMKDEFCSDGERKEKDDADN